VLAVWIVVAFLAFALAAAAAFNLFAYVRRARMPKAEDQQRLPVGLVDLVTGFAAECVALAVVLLTSPLAACMRVDVRRPEQRNDGCIILLHGWGLNSASLWWLRRRLLRHGFGRVIVLSYPRWRVDLERAATRLRQLILARIGGDERVTLVGHSLGGLVARHYLRSCDDERVVRLITLGTPHGGTLAAWQLLPCVRDLRPDSALITDLNLDDGVPDRFDVVAISSDFDALVLPADNASYRGAFNIQIRGVGHNALLFSRRVFKLLEESLLERGGPAAER
jgi:triacylglycerol lipase